MARPRTRRAAAESREKAEQAVGKAKVAEQIDVKADARKEDSVKFAKEVKETEQKSSGKRRRPSDLSPGPASVRDDKRRKVQLTSLVVCNLTSPFRPYLYEGPTEPVGVVRRLGQLSLKHPP